MKNQIAWAITPEAEAELDKVAEKIYKAGLEGHALGTKQAQYCLAEAKQSLIRLLVRERNSVLDKLEASLSSDMDIPQYDMALTMFRQAIKRIREEYASEQAS